MIKKIVIVCSMILSMNYCQAQLGDKEHAKVALQDIPLLFRFDRTNGIIKVSALTQSWVEVTDKLQKKAWKLIEPVAQEIVRKIVGKINSSNTHSYVRNSDCSLCVYDTRGKHTHYFLQDLCTAKYIKESNSLKIVG